MFCGEPGRYANRSRRKAHIHFCARIWARQGHAGGTVLLHEQDMPTATRDKTNDGVNDPIEARWGQAPGTAEGSFTPSLVQ